MFGLLRVLVEGTFLVGIVCCTGMQVFFSFAFRAFFYVREVHEINVGRVASFSYLRLYVCQRHPCRAGRDLAFCMGASCDTPRIAEPLQPFVG